MKPGHGSEHVDRIKRYGHDVTHGIVAQMFALVAGVVLTGRRQSSAMIVNADFSTGDAISTEGLLFMDVNGWSGLLMIVTGWRPAGRPQRGRRARKVSARRRRGLPGADRLEPVRQHDPRRMFPVNDMTAIVYAAIGVLGVTAGLGPERPRRRAVDRSSRSTSAWQSGESPQVAPRCFAGRDKAIPRRRSIAT